MLNPTFLENKVRRQIKQNGQEFEFIRYKEDGYHQVSDEESERITIEGIFHTSNSYVKASTDDGSVIRSKAQPMVLTLAEYARTIQIDDIMYFNDRRYKVIYLNDINAFGVIFDISLEMILDE